MICVNLRLVLSLPALGAARFQKRHVFFGKQSAVVKAEWSGCFIDGLECFDLVACYRAAFLEAPRRDENASFQRPYASVVGVEGAVEVPSDFVKVIRKHAQAI